MARTRFAPSPTGSLHVGNARIAVLNWLFARRHHGQFVLRIEDTDLERNVAGAERELLEDLRWLGLEWDEGPGVEGPHGVGPHAPYRQSERLPEYREQAERLLAGGHAFRCFCTPEELARKREAALARGAKPHYDGTCRELTRDEIARRERAGQRAAIRFRVPPEGDIVVRDIVRGEVRFALSEVSDFILLRADGLPTYNFAVVVDDADMRISHVIRGVGHLSNTPRQLLLYRALGHEPPVFAHVPTVLGPDRQKLSKRHGAQPLVEYRREGYHADALVNYLSLLAWSSPSGDEMLERARLTNEISLERIGIADVVFDPVKLRWLSAKHIERMSVAELTEAVSPYVDRERYPIAEEALPAVVNAIRSHLAVFSDINEHLDPFVPTLDDDGRRARAALRDDPRIREVLGAVRAALATVADWEETALNAAVRAAGQQAGASGRALYEPIRTALTGKAHGPPLAAVLYVLGRSGVLELLDEALAAP